MKKLLLIALLFAASFAQAQVSPSPLYIPTNSAAADSIIHIVNVNGVPRRVYNIDLMKWNKNPSFYAESPLSVRDAITVDGGDTTHVVISSIDSTYINFFINIQSFEANGTDLLSDRTAIQNCINETEIKGGTVVIPKGNYYLDSTLVLKSNTTILCQEGANIYLMDSVNDAMISNANKTTKTNLNILDSNINIIGGNWYANGDNQIRTKADTTVVAAFQFFGVKKLTMDAVKVYNSSTYAVDILNFKNIAVTNCYINQGDTLPNVLHNQDGIHFSGPGNSVRVTNSTFRTYDDAIALISDDNTWGGEKMTTGPISDVLIDGIVLDSSRKGFRLLSQDSLIDNVSISNVTGAVYSQLLEVSNYHLKDAGNFGAITASNINVASVKTPSTKSWFLPNNKFIIVGGKMDILKLSNITRHGELMYQSTIYIDTPTVMKTMIIDGLTDYRKDTLNLPGIQFRSSGVNINNLTITNHRMFVAADSSKNTGIDLTGLTSNYVSISNGNYDTLNTAINISGATIKNLILTNNRGGLLSKAIPIASSTIDTLFVNGRYFKGATRKAFSTTSSGNSITKLMAFIPVTATPGNTAVFDSIDYSYNGGNYSIKSPGTVGSYLPLSGGTMTGNIAMSAGGPTTPNIYITGATTSGIYYNTNYFGFTSFGVTKYFFQNASNRGLVMSNDMPISWASTAGANLSAPDIYFSRKSPGILQLSNDGTTGAAAIIVNGLSTGYIAVTANYTATAFDHTIDCTGGGTFTITLPTAVGIKGHEYVVTNSGTGTITIATSSQPFTNVTATPTSLTITSYGVYNVQSTGAAWVVTK